MNDIEWRVKKIDHIAASDLSFEMGVPVPIADIFIKRGLTTKKLVEEFCQINVKNLHNPFTLPDIESALERLIAALDNKEHIYVHGDYDVDGVTATAVVSHTLNLLGADFEVHVPHRMVDGYDLKEHIIDQAIASGSKLLLTVDCGVRALKPVEYASSLGLDIIITDHHHIREDHKLPECIAVINPNRHDSKYPFNGLAGVGIAFKVMAALAHKRGLSAKKLMEELIDLVALGTTADMAPMVDENRTLVSLGCESLTKTEKPGIKELLKIAGAKTVSTTTIGFALGPRINAIGRLADSESALRLMLEKNPDRAKGLALQLEEANRRRQKLQEQTVLEAEALLPENLDDTYSIVLAAKGWHKGLVGLVAGKIKDKFARPTLVVALFDESLYKCECGKEYWLLDSVVVEENTCDCGLRSWLKVEGIAPRPGEAVGSARSPQDFHLLDMFNAPGISEIFTKYGGHSAAAGFSFRAEKLDELRNNMNEYAKKIANGEKPTRYVDIDVKLDASEISKQTFSAAAMLAPFGISNLEPIYSTKCLKVIESKALGKESKHLKLRLKGLREKDPEVQALAWFRPDLVEEIDKNDIVDVAYELQEEEWQGRPVLQMIIKDLKLSV